MAVVKFCFASGYSPKVFTCGMEELPCPPINDEGQVSEATNCTPVRLGKLGILQYKTYTREIIKARAEVAKACPDEMKDAWRERIICVLGPLEAVFCINFIPLDPHKPQTLQVMRMDDLEEDAASCQVYCCDYSPYKFLLPKKNLDQIFDLSQWDFSLLDATLEPANLILALQYLQKEETLKGMALTLKGTEGNLQTYAWIKP